MAPKAEKLFFQFAHKTVSIIWQAILLYVIIQKTGISEKSLHTFGFFLTYIYEGPFNMVERR